MGKDDNKWIGFGIASGDADESIEKLKEIREKINEKGYAW